jgi:hypothetical protein
VQHAPAERPEQPLAEEQEDADGQQEGDEDRSGDRDADARGDDLDLVADLRRLGFREVDMRTDQREQRVLGRACLAPEAGGRRRRRRRRARFVECGPVGIQRSSSGEGVGGRGMPGRSYQRGPCVRTSPGGGRLAAA